ncbi:MAG TPA: hypothetical protein VE631_06695 [Alphaproteobacteria bacterium]|nr:hypothetical protein [Alphaproteobacteria bacterium]
MGMTDPRRRTARWLGVSLTALALSIAPMAGSLLGGPQAGIAMARGGGGAGGGNGAGNAGGNGVGASASAAAADNGAGHGNTGGHAGGNASSRGTTASALGNLNAAHASLSAFAHAALTSVVGQLAAYAKDVERGITAEQQQAELSDISNKSPVSPATVAEVNSVMGLDARGP